MPSPLYNSGAQTSAVRRRSGPAAGGGILPPEFGDAGSRFCSSQAPAAGTLSTASIGRLATAMMKWQQPRTISGGGGGAFGAVHKVQATAVAALSAVGGWMSKDREDSIMAKRFQEWIHGGDQGLARDSRDNAVRRRRHAVAEKSLLGPSPSTSTLESESELAAADGGGGGGTVVSTVDEPVTATASNSVSSPATPASAATNGSRFGFLRRLFFRPPPPSQVDWIEAGAVSLIVRTQDECGSCWAMAVAAAVEAAHYLKTKQHVSLSVQELVDCDTVNRGCDGGFPHAALEYVRKNGLSSESSYPYIDQRSAMGCSRAANGLTLAATISGYKVVFPNETALERAVAKGPVVVGVQSTDEMRNYQGGIMEYRAISPYTAARRRLDGGTMPRMHAVLMVGYGTDDNGVKYWRFKNSWGSGWGEWGFGRFRRRACGRGGAAGMCLFPAVYPVLD